MVSPRKNRTSGHKRKSRRVTYRKGRKSVCKLVIGKDGNLKRVCRRRKSTRRVNRTSRSGSRSRAFGSFGNGVPSNLSDFMGPYGGRGKGHSFGSFGHGAPDTLGDFAGPWRGSRSHGGGHSGDHGGNVEHHPIPTFIPEIDANGNVVMDGNVVMPDGTELPDLDLLTL